MAVKKVLLRCCKVPYLSQFRYNCIIYRKRRLCRIELHGFLVAVKNVIQIELAVCFLRISLQGTIAAFGFIRFLVDKKRIELIIVSSCCMFP